MANIFSLDASVRRIAADVLDDLLANTADGGLGKTCLLQYADAKQECPNCIFDPQARTSTSRPKPNPTQPFPVGTRCPVCNGDGFVETSRTEEITMSCSWKPSHFSREAFNLNIQVPYSLLETKFYMADVPKVLRATGLIFQLPVAPYLNKRFVRHGEPGDPSNIVQGRYAVCLWKRQDA